MNKLGMSENFIVGSTVMVKTSQQLYTAGGKHSSLQLSYVWKSGDIGLHCNYMKQKRNEKNRIVTIMYI